MTSTFDMLESALRYASRDVRVFPIYEITNGKCSCGNADCKSPGKHPRVKNGITEATQDEAQIRSWWRTWPAANIGVACGEQFWVLDVDPRHGGNESLSQLIQQHGMLPETVMINTGGGGRHYYFQTNGVSVKQRMGFLPGLDAISKGYVVAPPSIHISGNRYEVAGSAEEFAPAPAWLMEMVAAKPESKKEPFDTAAALLGVPEGERDETLWRLACKLRNADVPFDAALTLVLQSAASCIPSFPAGVAREKVERAYHRYDPGPDPAEDPSWAAADDPSIADEEFGRREREAFQYENEESEPGPAAKDAPKFIVHWAREALEPQPPRVWTIENLIGPGDVAVTIGDAGSKKTWSHLDQAVCVALGKEWLGRRTVRTTVLVVDEESGERRLKTRLGDCMRGHGAGADLPIRFTSLAGITLSCQDGANFLQEVIRETGAGFVMMDALQDFALGMDENSGKEMTPVIHRLRRVAESCQCVIWLLHHLNKAGGYRGHSSIRGLVDLMLKCESDSASSLINFTADKTRDSLVTPFSATAHFEIGRFWLSDAGPKARAATLSRSEKYVIAFLEKQPNSTAAMTAIQDNADSCSSDAARRAVYKLAGDGKLARTDAGGRGISASYRLCEVLL